MTANLENSGHRMEKISFYSNPKAGDAKESSNYCELFSFHILARLCSKVKFGFSSM